MRERIECIVCGGIVILNNYIHQYCMTRSVFLKSFCFLGFAIHASLLQAQQNPVNSLYKLINLPHAGDSIVKQQVDYIDPGMAGTNITWNFRSVHPVNEYYNLRYQIIDTNSFQMAGIEHSTVYHYLVQGDSLLHTGYENSTTFMKYSAPELKLRFPFHYGDTISSCFSGEGEYCHRIALHVAGTTIISADAIGTLYTPLGLTFKNVLRVKSLREYSQTGMDSLTMQLESYAWYVAGNRYPVFETVKTATRKTGNRETENKVASLFYPPSEQALLLADTTNWSKEILMDETLDVDQFFTNYKLIPNPVQSELRIEYDLTCDSGISFKVFDNNGIAIFDLPLTAKQAGHYSEIINMHGFPAGIYLINVKINKKAKVIKFIKI